MSIRQSRISQEFGMLKKMLKKGEILQLKPFDAKKKSIDHLKILIAGPKGTAYQGGKFKLEVRFPAQYPKKPPFCRLHTANSNWFPISLAEFGTPTFGRSLQSIEDKGIYA
ncbi:MAG: ubiquitin-conjugating enzyme E2 variant [Promethearchaeota archaeon]